MLSGHDMRQRAEGFRNRGRSTTPPTPPSNGGERAGGDDAGECPATPPWKGGERTEGLANPGETAITCKSPPLQGGSGGVAELPSKPETTDLTALAAAQAALVRSLTIAAPTPDGFDPQLVA